MKKIIHGLLGALLAVSAVQAKHSNKTYMAARGTLSDNCLIGMSARPMAGQKGSFGANVSVAGFYRQSHNALDMAKYFGDGLTDATRLGTITVTAGEIDYESTASAGTAGTVTYNPRRIEYGAHINWTQSLDKFVKDLSLSVDVPVVRDERNIRVVYSNLAANANVAGQNINTVFAGSALGNTSPTQAALAYQKHSTVALHETGVADIAAKVGYKFAGDADYSICGSINAVIPTGKKPAAVNVFESVYGSKHFSLGASLHTNFNLWRSEDGKSSFDFNAGACYKYGFRAKETRTMGLYDHVAGSVVDSGQYQIVADNSATGVKNLANISTMDLDVTPQSSVDAVAGFSYSMNRFRFNLNYNMMYAQEEKLAIPSGASTTALTTHGLAVAGSTSTGAVALHASGAFAKPGDKSSTKYYVDLGAATTPSRLTHKVGGGVDYSFDTKTPIHVGMFGEGEFNANNSSMCSWAVGAKLGICF